ncbi:phage holin family protein [Terricaulis sp.]|uniref:phage holin family protein n=1 Tax=Terricaulis sp. TaxID=2768686 RepID=UPI002AC39AE7|nr:phage holin family protein [Terricaulis sp.]MDZ4690931.1 phage holin family protein [Terricaulis sp.]
MSTSDHAAGRSASGHVASGARRSADADDLLSGDGRDRSEARSLPELAKDLLSHASDLIRNEARLARAEAVESLQRVAGGMVRAALGLVFTGAAAVMCLLALAYGLEQLMPRWSAALVSAAIGGIIAYGLIRSGRDAASKNALTPPKTAEQISKDVRLVEERVHS